MQALPPPVVDWCQPPQQMQVVSSDDFRRGLVLWRLEAEDPRARVTAEEGVLDIATPAGLSLWWHRPLQGDYAIRFTALALPAPASAAALAGRLSDLNMFWNATEADGSEPAPRDGRFASYDNLRTYYVGFGANGNQTTRFRRYDGLGRRALLDGWADGGEATPEDSQGAMQAHTRLQPGQPVQVLLQSRQPGLGVDWHVRWSVNGRPLFVYQDPTPWGRGWFALRTTASRLQLRSFEVFQCSKP